MASLPSALEDLLRRFGDILIDDENKEEARLLEAAYSELIELEMTAYRFEVAADHLLEGIIITNDKDIITYINRSACQMHGLTEKEVMNQNVTTLYKLTEKEIMNQSVTTLYEPAKAESAWREMQKQVLTKGRWQGELWNIRKDGTRFPALVSAIRYVNPTPEKETLLTMYIVRDVTELKVEMLTQQATQLWMAELVHDIKTPLTIAKGYADLLIGRDLSPSERKKYLGTIEKSLEEMEHFIELAGHAAKPLYQPEHIDANSSLRGLVETYKRSGQGRQYTFTPDFSAQGTVLVDKTDINRMIYNLLKNSCEALNGQHEGKISVHTANVEIAEERKTATGMALLPGQYIVISVEDNGAGIPETVQQKMFTPFITTKNDGTGLGLLSIKQSTERNSGVLDYETSSKGTTFSVYFPHFS